MLTSLKIRSAFVAPPAPVPVTLAYRLRLLGIIAGISALLALYLALIVLVAAFAWYWLLFGTIFAITGFTVFLWFAPPAAALVVIFGLIRPLVRERPTPPKQISISAENEPVLFEFLDRLSSMLNAPRPAEVCVNLDVNATASLISWTGLLTGKFRLTIGLPLAAGFTLPQMAGVLAHELGHFSQGAGLRSYFLISKAGEWLLRVAQERDSWDVWIESNRRAGKWWVMIVANLAWMGLMISRKYLAALARVAHWMTAAFSRHMEFDADRHEAAIVGAAVFEETTMRLPQLRVAAELAWRNVYEGWALRRAPEDLPGMIVAVDHILTDETTARVREETLTLRTRPGDFHPCNVERIQAVRDFNAPPLFQLEGEARLLFTDLQALSHTATLHHYETINRLDRCELRFLSVEDSVTALQAKSAGSESVRLLFHSSPEFVADWAKFPTRELRRSARCAGRSERRASVLGGSGKSTPAFLRSDNPRSRSESKCNQFPTAG
jgi:Zn-dependent protease with chaperone function